MCEPPGVPRTDRFNKPYFCPFCEKRLPLNLISQIRFRPKHHKLTLENAKSLIAKTNASKRKVVGGSLIWKEHQEKAAEKKKCRCRDCQIARGWTLKELEKWEKFEALVEKRKKEDQEIEAYRARLHVEGRLIKSRRKQDE